MTMFMVKEPLKENEKLRRPSSPPPPQKPTHKPVDLWKDGGLELFVIALTASIKRGKENNK